MMAHRKTITFTALHARLKKAVAALPLAEEIGEGLVAEGQGLHEWVAQAR
jgi:hypothetical protein